MRAQCPLAVGAIRVVLVASALAPLALPVPSAGDHWRIETLAVDGASALAVAREPDDALWVPLRSGAHTIRIVGRTLGDTLSLAFPLAPRTLSVDAAGWDTSGVTAGRLVSGALNLSRQPHAGLAAAGPSWAGSADFPAFVRVMRDVRFDLDWSVTTTVERVAPQSAAFTVAVPLMPGESVLSEGLEVRGEGVRPAGQEPEIGYRSPQGARHTSQLPKDGSVTHVAVDGSPTQIRPDGGELPLSILPGQHTVSIGWRSQQGESPASSPDAVDLRAPSGNVTTNIALLADRWPLVAFGAGVGPAFLYWGELLVFIVVASLLGRWPQSPLRTTEWLLLGLGLSTLSWSVLVTVAAWLFAMRWRERSRGAPPSSPA